MTTLVAGRGAQVTLTGLAQQAARGSYTTTLKGNTAEKVALELAGTAPDGSTANGTTLTGAAPVDPLYGSLDGTVNMGRIAGSVTDSITAKASGNHATATPLTTFVNNVATVATDADSVVLPVMNPGEMVIITNSGTKAAQVFGAGTATINAVATDTGVSLTKGATGIYVAVTAGKIFGGMLA